MKADGLVGRFWREIAFFLPINAKKRGCELREGIARKKMIFVYVFLCVFFLCFRTPLAERRRETPQNAIKQKFFWVFVVFL
jgi:hypothetical protein